MITKQLVKFVVGLMLQIPLAIDVILHIIFLFRGWHHAIVWFRHPLRDLLISLGLTIIGNIILLTLNRRDVIPSIKWKRMFHDYAYGPYPFPETPDERKALRAWVEETLTKHSLWAHQALRDATKKERSLNSLLGENVSKPMDLLTMRAEIRKAQKEVKKTQERSNKYFKDTTLSGIYSNL